MDKKNFGKSGEDLAAVILKNEGFHILERNFLCRYGEVDLICEKENCLLFVEVKTRRTDAYGTPEEAIDRNKKSHIRNTAAYYISTHRMENREVEFQVIGITVNQIRHAF